MMTRQILALSFMFAILVSSLSARVVPFSTYERAGRIVDRLMQIHNIGLENRSILRQNSIYNLAGFFSTRDLYLAPFWDEKKLLAKLAEPNFWAEKLQRDLMVPFTNEEVERRFEKIQSEVNFFQKYLSFMNHNNSPVQIYIFGSIVKGRWGANSDLDLFVDSSDKDLLRRLEYGIYKESHPSFTGNIEIFTSFFEPANILDPLVPISLRELRDLKGFYQKILGDIGFKLVGSGKSLDMVRLPVPPKMYVEFNPIEDRVFYLTLKTHEAMHQIGDQFTVFQDGAGQGAKRIAEKLTETIGKLSSDWSEVESDLQLIRDNTPSARLHRIRKVIDSHSWTKMKQEGMVEYMLHVSQRQIQALIRAKKVLSSKE